MGLLDAAVAGNSPYAAACRSGLVLLDQLFVGLAAREFSLRATASRSPVSAATLVAWRNHAAWPTLAPFAAVGLIAGVRLECTPPREELPLDPLPPRSQDWWPSGEMNDQVNAGWILSLLGCQLAWSRVHLRDVSEKRAAKETRMDRQTWSLLESGGAERNGRMYSTGLDKLLFAARWAGLHVVWVDVDQGWSRRPWQVEPEYAHLSRLASRSRVAPS